MWLFLSGGFLSVVADPKSDRLVARARVRADLERLRTYFAFGPILENAGTDYRYRARITRAAFADGLATAGSEIDYRNFKNEVLDRLGPQRAAVYHDVWATLLDGLDDDPRPRNLPMVTNVPTTPRARRRRRGPRS